MARNKIGTVVLNWNKRDDLLKCLDSLSKQTLSPDLIVVVDNGSSDNSPEFVRRHFPQCELLVHNDNLGGTAGFNSGIRYLLRKGAFDYIHLLDNDVVLHGSALETLVAYLDEHPDVAIAGSKILTMEKSNRIQEVGAYINWKKGSIEPIGKGCCDSDEYCKTFDVDYVPACSLLARVDAVVDVGLMDEGNFLYWDDIEWGRRFKENGYSVVAVGSSIVWHKMGAATNSSPRVTYYFWRNKFNFFLHQRLRRSDEDGLNSIINDWCEAFITTTFLKKSNTRKALVLAFFDAIRNCGGKTNYVFRNDKYGEDVDHKLCTEGAVNLIRECSDSTLLPMIEKHLMKLCERLVINNKDNVENGNTVIPVKHIFFSKIQRTKINGGELYVMDVWGNIHVVNWRLKLARVGAFLGKFTIRSIMRMTCRFRKGRAPHRVKV